MSAEVLTDTPEIYDQVEQLLGEAQGFTNGWIVNRIRDDQAVDAYIPIGKIDTGEIPVDPKNVERLLGLMIDYAKKSGGTGQRDPIVVGHVRGEALYTMDGFHRCAVQRARNIPLLHCTVEPNLTYEQVVNRRLEYANTHPEVEFARQVELVQSIWERTPWSAHLPNVLTAFRAVQDDYALDRSAAADASLIDKLPNDIYDAICAWVYDLSKTWGYTPKEIRDNLAKGEGFSPELMRLVYQRTGKPPVGRIGLSHVEVITEVYPGEEDIQKVLVDTIIRHELTIPQSRVLVETVESGSPLTDVDALGIIMDLNIRDLKAKSSVKNAKKTPSRNNNQGRISLFNPETARLLSADEFLKIISDTLPEVLATLEDDTPSREVIDSALNISLQLANFVAETAENS